MRQGDGVPHQPQVADGQCRRDKATIVDGEVEEQHKVGGRADGESLQ